MGTKSMFSMPGDRAVASPAAPREEKDRWPNTRQKRADVIVRFRLPRYRLGRLQLRRRCNGGGGRTEFQPDGRGDGGQVV